MLERYISSSAVVWAKVSFPKHRLRCSVELKRGESLKEEGALAAIICALRDKPNSNSKSAREVQTPDELQIKSVCVEKDSWYGLVLSTYPAKGCCDGRQDGSGFAGFPHIQREND